MWRQCIHFNDANIHDYSSSTDQREYYEFEWWKQTRSSYTFVETPNFAQSESEVFEFQWLFLSTGLDDDDSS